MPEWPGIVAVNAKRYLKGASDNTIRNHVILRELQRRGRITYNENGDDLSWQMKFRKPPVEAVGDGTPRSFTPFNPYRRATIDWRGYDATDALTEKVRLMNSGNVALIKYYSTKLPELVETVTEALDEGFYVDGYAPGNQNHLCGIESMMGTGTTAAGDRIAKPADSYANIDTTPQAYGGNWSSGTTTHNADLATDWPDGSGSAEYDFNSPIIVNWSSNAWGTSAATDWQSNCENAIRHLISWTKHTQGTSGHLNLVLLAEHLYTNFKTKMSGRLTINVAHQESQDLGFSGEALNFDGVKIMSGYGVPMNTGYGLNFDRMRLRCMYPQLLKSEGPDYDIDTRSYKFATAFYGNLQFESAKWFGKLKNVA